MGGVSACIMQVGWDSAGESVELDEVVTDAGNIGDCIAQKPLPNILLLLLGIRTILTKEQLGHGLESTTI